MTLVLEIEYLAGVSFAAIGPDSPVPEWPPQPDRVFSALVATWAARGQVHEEGEALKWLETQAPPRILDRGGEARTSAIVFVPPNDPRSDRQKTARAVLPALRSRQPRRFPAVRLTDPVVRLFWAGAVPEPVIMEALKRLSHDTAYIGHSSSLTRCRFLIDQNAPGLSEATIPKCRVYAGRFRELGETYARFEKSADRKDRPQKGPSVTKEPTAVAPRENVFSDRWLLLEHVRGNKPDVRGNMPDVRACALVARTIRDTILSGFQRIGLGDRIPEVVSGHASDGRPSRAPHVAIVPLTFTGFPYSDGHVLGFALIPPRDAELLEDPDFRRALRVLAPLDEERGRRVLHIKMRARTAPDQTFSIELSPSFEAGRRSLDPALYVAPARTFATVTPIALNRHLKVQGEGRDNEMRAQIVAACGHIGLPEPEDVVVDKHSAVEGAPSAYPSGKSPSWMHWRVPPSLASRQLTHAVIRFAEPVDGPVIIGAGRFLGLGLCRPLDPPG